MSSLADASDEAPAEEWPPTACVAGERQSLSGVRIRAVIVAVAALVAVLFPLSRALDRDSFPLSNFPMFTHDPPPVSGFVRAIGVGADGADVVLSPELAGGTVEVVHAAQTLSTALRQGRAGELCAEIADRVAASGRDIVEVLIVTDRFEIVDALRVEHPRPIGRHEHAACEVPR